MTDPDRDNQTRALPGQLKLSAGPGGDLEGTDDRVLQAGADYLARLGGGILQVMPGTYDMHNALYLHEGLTLRGFGSDDDTAQDGQHDDDADTRDGLV
jgi:uncharacterized protein (DUF2345 family)